MLLTTILAGISIATFGLPFVLMGFGLVYCSSTCGTFPDPYTAAPEEGECATLVSSTCCYTGVAFISCDSAAAPANLTDTASIDALKTSNKIITYNNVIVTRNKPTTITFPAGCGKNILVAKEELIDIVILDGDLTHLDESHFDTLSQMNNKFGIALQTNDDYTYLAKDWIEAFDTSADLPATQMGIECTITEDFAKLPFAENEPCRWGVQLKIRYTGVLKGSLIPAWIGQF